MLQTNLLASGHADLVTHVTYDFYGERLATCSADQKIKLFRKSHEGTWDQETEWKAHDAPILHLSFAHPVHGSLLASSSHDRTVRIWEEPTGREREGRWIERAVLTGAKGSVKQVEFGTGDSGSEPRVATISTDSYLRIYSSADPSLSDWSLLQPIHVPSLPPPGSNDEPPLEAGAGSTNELANGGWGLSWCKERWWGSIISVFSGISPTVKILSIPIDTSSSANSILFLNPPSSSSTASLTSIAWAPSCGRSYHLIATGSRDGTIRIWRVEPPSEKLRVDYNDDGYHDGVAGGQWKGECVADFGKGGARIGMVDWNATGTTLTTTDDEGVVRIYKPTYARSWKLLGQMTAEEPPHEDGNGQ